MRLESATRHSLETGRSTRTLRLPSSGHAPSRTWLTTKPRSTSFALFVPTPNESLVFVPFSSIAQHLPPREIDAANGRLHQSAARHSTLPTQNRPTIIGRCLQRFAVDAGYREGGSWSFFASAATESVLGPSPNSLSRKWRKNMRKLNFATRRVGSSADGNSNGGGRRVAARPVLEADGR